ncbi:MAG TPA: BrnT family toxin [Rhizomicrobium sp.]|nr:BrnT family toxin [Rhizomicrobium sp.]
MAELIFEWDLNKARTNARKHGVAFDEAREVFFDPLKLQELEGIDHGEVRWRTIGEAFGRILVVCHTFEGKGEDEIIRIISARKASRSERRAYEGQA